MRCPLFGVSKPLRTELMLLRACVLVCSSLRILSLGSHCFFFLHLWCLLALTSSFDVH